MSQPVQPSPAPTDDQLELPLRSWDEGLYLKARDGSRLKRWGSVREACRILFGCDREHIYYLIESGAVEGRKLKPHRPNSHYKVDLLGVWEIREKGRRS